MALSHLFGLHRQNLRLLNANSVIKSRRFINIFSMFNKDTAEKDQKKNLNYQAKQLEERQNDAICDLAHSTFQGKKSVEEVSVVKKKRRWTRYETAVLITAKRHELESLFIFQQRAPNRWQTVLEFLVSHGIQDRDVLQCMDRWYNLKADYVTIAEFQRRTNLDYFTLTRTQKTELNCSKTRGLLTSDLFRMMDHLMSERFLGPESTVLLMPGEGSCTAGNEGLADVSDLNVSFKALELADERTIEHFEKLLELKRNRMEKDSDGAKELASSVRDLASALNKIADKL